MNNTEAAIKELYRAFHKLNKEFYKGKLPEPIILISPSIRTNYLGWFTPDKIWVDPTSKEERHEIGISAEYLNRPYLEVIATLHHEMIHLYCKVNDIKDTSKKGRYHNAKFKAECEARGLKLDQDDPDPRRGWYVTKLTVGCKKTIEGFKLDEKAFKIARVVAKNEKEKKPSYKYCCEECEISFTLKKELNLTCTDCGNEFDVTEKGIEED